MFIAPRFYFVLALRRSAARENVPLLRSSAQEASVSYTHFASKRREPGAKMLTRPIK
jgi:hypothetical protein